MNWKLYSPQKRFLEQSLCVVCYLWTDLKADAEWEGERGEDHGPGDGGQDPAAQADTIISVVSWNKQKRILLYFSVLPFALQSHYDIMSDQTPNIVGRSLAGLVTSFWVTW